MTLLVIALLTIITHFWRYGQPAGVVFDEVLNGPFIHAYWQGTNFYHNHPPFTKMLIALLGHWEGLDLVAVKWARIGASIPEAITDIRLIPILCGTLLPILIYYICRNLNFSRLAAMTVSVLLCLENSLITHSRFLLQDSAMICFGFAGILAYQKFRKSSAAFDRYSWGWLILSAILCSASFGTKWTGLAFAGVIGMCELWRLVVAWKQHQRKPGAYTLLRNGLGFLVIFILFYTATFAVHFSVLHVKYSFFSTGKGSFVSEFYTLNKRIFKDQNSINFHHNYASKWYTWPIMKRSVYYYWRDASGSQIYLLGNPLIYWLGSASVLITLGYAIRQRIKKRSSPIAWFVVCAFAISYLPYALLRDPLYLYHYETALVWSIIAIGYAIDLILNDKKRYQVTFLILAASLILFLYFSPLTYGTPVTQKELNSMFWFSSWR